MISFLCSETINNHGCIKLVIKQKSKIHLKEREHGDDK